MTLYLYIFQIVFTGRFKNNDSSTDRKDMQESEIIAMSLYNNGINRNIIL